MSAEAEPGVEPVIKTANDTNNAANGKEQEPAEEVRRFL